jgi:hypothetical protein
MKTFGQIILLCLLISVLQLAMAGVMLLLAGAAVVAFIVRPREAMAVGALLGLGALTIHYPLAVFGTVAAASAVGWVVHRFSKPEALPPLLLPPPADR